MIATRAVASPRDGWSFGRAFVVAMAPILGAIVAAWIELSTLGESPMWFVAGGFFLAAPGVAAVAAGRSPDPRVLRVVVAILLAGALFAIWVYNVPVPTHPGVYIGGGSRVSGAAMSVLAALAWYTGSGRALAAIRSGHPILGTVFGALTQLGASVVAFLVGSYI